MHIYIYTYLGKVITLHIGSYGIVGCYSHAGLLAAAVGDQPTPRPELVKTH